MANVQTFVVAANKELAVSYKMRFRNDDWYAYDVMSKEIDTVETFNTVTSVTRKLEALADKIDRQQMTELLQKRNPAKTLRWLYETVLV